MVVLTQDAALFSCWLLGQVLISLILSSGFMFIDELLLFFSRKFALLTAKRVHHVQVVRAFSSCRSSFSSLVIPPPPSAANLSLKPLNSVSSDSSFFTLPHAAHINIQPSESEKLGLTSTRKKTRERERQGICF